MVTDARGRLYDALVALALLLVGLVAVFPLLYVLSVSLTPISEVLRNGGFIVFPRTLTLSAYREFLDRPEIPRAFGVTIFLTIVGTLLNLLLTCLMAYPLSKRGLPGRRWLTLLVVIPLIFNGGIIPTYLMVKATGLLNTVWAMIIPNAIWSFNVLIMKGFFEGLPEELFEAARLDGAGEWQILTRIALPLSKPVLLTVGLFYGVSHWNEFFQALLYVTDRNLQPLQVVVRTLLRQAQQPLEAEVAVPTLTLQMAAVVLATLPIVLVYPFVQRHFTKGILLGSVKG